MNDAEIIQGFDNEKDKSLKIQLQKVEGLEKCIVVILSGYIDTYNSTFFQKRVTTLIDAGYTQIIFNCSHLDYVSSTGIGSFTAFLKAVKGKGLFPSVAVAQACLETGFGKDSLSPPPIYNLFGIKAPKGTPPSRYHERLQNGTTLRRRLIS